MNDDDLDIRRLLGILQRQAKLIIATVAFILAVAVLAVFSITPLYTGTTLVLVDPSRKNLLDPTNSVMPTSADSARVDSEVELVASEKVLRTVIRDGIDQNRESLINDPEFGVKLGLRDKLLAFLRIEDANLPSGDEAVGVVVQNLQKAISVSRRGLTYLIVVNARSEDPVKAAKLSNAIADAYIAAQLDSKTQGVVSNLNKVQRQIKDSQQGLVVAERNIDNYFDRLIAETGRADLASLRDRVRSLQSQESDLESRIVTLRESISSNDYEALTTSLGTQAAAELAAQRTALIDSLRQTQESTAAALDLRAELARVENAILQESETALDSFRSTMTNYDVEGTSLRQELNSMLLNSGLPKDTLAELRRLQETSINAASQHQALIARSQALETEAALQVPDSHVASPAFPPSDPSYPNVPLVLAVATMVALGIGAGFAFLFENYIGGFTSEGQVEAVTRLPIATVIPHHTDAEGRPSVSDYLCDSPLSMFAESIRRLRVAIDHLLPRPSVNGKGKKRGRVIMISSALPNEGKSTVALSLARTLAISGASTVILDCDLRKPSIQRQLNVDLSTGLADLLSGAIPNDDLSNLIRSDPKTDLTVVLGDRRSDVPTDQLFMTNTFARLIASASERFDYVILDTPPIEPVVDGLYLAKYADLIVYVIRWAKTPQSITVKALKKLGESKREDAKVVALLNQQELGQSTQYYAYRDYYSDS